MAKNAPVKLAFREAVPESSPSEKPPVILAHGFNGSNEYWTNLPQVVANATKRKVYAIDARNHGDSEWSDVFTFETNVDDLLHFMDSIGAPKAIIIGSSMGGITGMKMALTKPERVEKLIVEDMNVQKLPQEMFSMAEMFFSLTKNALPHIPDDVDEKTAKKILVDRIFKQLPEGMKSYVKPELLERDVPLQLKRTEEGRYTYKANIEVLEKAVKDPSRFDVEYSGVYEGPALFIYGKQSPFQVEADEPNIRKHFPNAELFGLENAMHAIYMEFPQEFTKAVLKFIAKE